MTPGDPAIGRRIRRLRKTQGLTQQTLAERAEGQPAQSCAGRSYS